MIKNKKILLLGLSNKPNLEPFDSSTNSGKLIDMIIQRCEDYRFTKSNLVSFAPLDNNNKLRYPNNKELLEGANKWSNKILKYDLIVLFGNKVQETILKDERFKNINYICATHPSYIWVYKHNEMNDYINEIIKKIKTTLKE